MDNVIKIYSNLDILNLLYMYIRFCDNLATVMIAPKLRACFDINVMRHNFCINRQ